MSGHRRAQGRFAADELAIVLSHYNLGTIESITEFRRGSRRSPKVGVVCEKGKFLLKKRDRERGGMERVEFSHSVQTHLSSKGFPLPALVCPKDSSDTIVRYKQALYELFEFVSGHGYSGEGRETRDAGRVLAKFHQAMSDFRLDKGPISTGFHDATAVQTGLNAIPSRVSSHDSAAGQDAEILGMVGFLFDAYSEAGGAVEQEGFESWPEGVTHSDWHPGNLLFKRGGVLAVMDYDCAKVGRVATDVANGALQFSMVSADHPDHWPDHLDVERLQQFLQGYLEIADLPEQQARALPNLMIEALIAESVLPVAVTGVFGPHAGFGFMRMIRRKVTWIKNNMQQLQDVATTR